MCSAVFHWFAQYEQDIQALEPTYRQNGVDRWLNRTRNAFSPQQMIDTWHQLEDQAKRLV